MPKDDQVVDSPTDGENPFFVLTEDDQLITHISVETDVLLEPIVKDRPDVNDARLVITVKTRPFHHNRANDGM